jgi:hypothetical protein
MTPLDGAAHDVAAAGACTLDLCRCPTCGVVEALLRAELAENHKVRDFDVKRVHVRANDFAGGAHPYLASVRVDGREVYRIHARPDEVFAHDVLEDIVKALRRPM